MDSLSDLLFSVVVLGLSLVVLAGPASRVRPSWWRAGGWLLMGLLLLPYLLACGMAFPCMDDWVYGAAGRNGWWLAQGDWYLDWSGRVAATAVISGWGMLGSPWFASVVGYRLVITALVVAVALGWRWFLSAMCQGSFASQRTATWLAGLSLWFVALPDPTDSVYWLSGSATYTAGLACLLAWAASVRTAWCTQARGWWYAALALGMLAAWFNEVQVVVLVAAVSVLVVVADAPRRWGMLAVALGVWIAAGVSILAPGNFVRMHQSHVSGSLDVIQVVSVGGPRVVGVFGELPWVLLFAGATWWFVTIDATADRAPADRRRFWLHLAAVLAAIGIAMVPLVFIGANPRRAYTLITALLVAVPLLGAWQLRSHPRWLGALAVALACLAVVGSVGPGWQVVVVLGCVVLLVAWAAKRGWFRHVSRDGVACACLLAALAGTATWRKVCADVVGLGYGSLVAQHARFRHVSEAPTQWHCVNPHDFARVLA